MNPVRKHKFRIRPAFTLVELVISMTVMLVLMGGVTSALVLASKAVPDRQTPLSAVGDTYQALGQFQSELATAKRMKSMSATQVSFTVADRNNDGFDETILYIWSGTSGTSLRRKYNNDALTDVIGDVREFQLTYDKQTVPSTVTPGPKESNEAVLVSYTLSGTPTDYTVNANAWIGQYFKPTLPADATSWKVTRVRIKAKVNGTNSGISRIELRTPTGSYQPSATVLDDANMIESMLADAYGWQEFTFGSVSGISPSQGLCLVVKRVGGTNPCDIQRGPEGSATGNFNAVTSPNGGTTWTTGTEAVPFQVYGTVTTTSTPTATSLEKLPGIRVRLRVGSDANAGVDSGVQLLNQPEL